MRVIVQRKLSGHLFGIFLCLVGFGILFVVLWKAWPSVSSSSNVLSSLWSYILTEQTDLALIGTLKLVYLSIIGGIFLFLGIFVLAFSRQILYLSGGPILLQCPYCNNHWKARRAMGWAECPHCRKFIHPQVMKTGK